MKIDPSSTTTHVWQMDYSDEPGQIGVAFREIRLPRSVRLEFPRSLDSMPDTWLDKSLFLVAAMEDQLVGYLTLSADIETKTAKSYRSRGGAEVTPTGNWISFGPRCAGMGFQTEIQADDA